MKQLLISLCVLIFCTSPGTAGVIYQTALQGILVNNGFQLEWSTSSEFNHNYFLVQRSVNGIDFESIAQIREGINTSAAKNYQYLDNQYYGIRAYYRLIQVDQDGASTPSALVLMNKKSPDSNFAVTGTSGNVTSSDLKLLIQSKAQTELKYKYLTASGENIQEGVAPVQKGENTVSFAVAHLQPGLYQLVLRMYNEMEIFSFKKEAGQQLPDQLAARGSDVKEPAPAPEKKPKKKKSRKSDRKKSAPLTQELPGKDMH